MHLSENEIDDLSEVSLAELSAAKGWQQQYRFIARWGQLIQLKPDIRRAENLIKGCELPVWLTYKIIDELYYFLFDSDSKIINGLAALLIVQMQGKSQTELQSLRLEFFLRELGLDKHLTPSRNNGLRAIIARCAEIAQAA